MLNIGTRVRLPDRETGTVTKAIAEDPRTHEPLPQPLYIVTRDRRTSNGTLTETFLEDELEVVAPPNFEAALLKSLALASAASAIIDGLDAMIEEKKRRMARFANFN